jgi:cysteine synthase
VDAASSVDAEITELSRQGADVFFINWSRNGSVLTAATKLAKAKKPIKLIGIRPDQYFIANKEAQKFLIGYVNQRFDSAITDLFSAAISGRSITEEVDAVKGVFK